MLKLIKMLFCKHDYQFVCNFYGDQIIIHDWNRSLWRCSKCDKQQLRGELHRPENLDDK